MTASSTVRKQCLRLDIEVTHKQKKALLSALKALDIEVKQRELTEEEEDIALGIAIEEGKKEGKLSEKEEFEKWLFSGKRGEV